MPNGGQETSRSFRIPSALVATVLFSCNARGECAPSLGVDPQALAGAPIGECVGIDIRTLDDVPLRLKATLRFLRKLAENLPCSGEAIGILTDSEEGRIIFLPNPRNTSGARVVIA